MKLAFDIKASRIDILSIKLHTVELDEIEQSLQSRIEKYHEFFSMLFFLDMQNFSHPDSLNIEAIINLFSNYSITITGIQHSNISWSDYAKSHGLIYSHADTSISKQELENTVQSFEAIKIIEPSIIKPTMMIELPIRTGQQVYAEQSDLIVMGVVSEGAEIIADGNIHVYGPMRGRALAGASGNTNAKIFIHSMQAELVSIAGIYHKFEQDLPTHLHKKAVQVYLQEKRIIISALNH